MSSNLNVSRYQEELNRRALVMERTLLLISPISVLSLLDIVFVFRAFIDWAFFKQDFYSNPNLVFIGYSRYIILPLILVIFVYNVYSISKEIQYERFQGQVK